MAKYTYRILHNGREVENLGAEMFHSESVAREAGEIRADDLCPPHSPSRKFYYVEAVIVHEDGLTEDDIRSLADDHYADVLPETDDQDRF